MTDLFDAIDAWLAYSSIEVAWRSAAEELRGLAAICSDRSCWPAWRRRYATWASGY